MTNEQIIFNERVKLMDDGKIGTTGRSIVVETIQGKKIQLMEPEEIHTFQAWKSLGYSVKKGEKAVAKFTIWKATENKDPDEENPEIKMFLKMSAFFSAAQVEKTNQKRESGKTLLKFS